LSSSRSLCQSSSESVIWLRNTKKIYIYYEENGSNMFVAVRLKEILRSNHLPCVLINHSSNYESSGVFTLCFIVTYRKFCDTTLFGQFIRRTSITSYYIQCKHDSLTYVSSNAAVFSVIIVVTTYHVGSVRFDLTFLDTKHVMTFMSL
jgi:hypothetical protein